MPFSASPPALFPTYLLPTLPFRQRRQSSVSSTCSSTTSSTATAAAAVDAAISPPSYLNGHASHLRCTRCLADLALATQIISKGFTGRHGRAYLVAPPPETQSQLSGAAAAAAAAASSSASSSSGSSTNGLLPNLPNTFTHKPVPRQLVTGAHTVADVACAHCGSVLGWKYVAAADEAQRYKVGKVILETKRVCRSSTWEAAGEEDSRGGGGGMADAVSRVAAEPDAVEFDSQDEDECEDLFMGLWTPRLAAKRRRAKTLAKGKVEL